MRNNFQRVVFCFVCSITFSSAGLGQIEIHAFGGGNFGDRFNVNGGQARVRGSALFGASIWYETISGLGVEVEYMRQSTTGEVTSSFLIDSDIPMNFNYVLGGGHWVYTPNESVRTNLGIKFGATGFYPDTDRYNNVWKFTAAFNAGMRYYITERIGLRAQLHLLMPIQFGAGTFWAGNGGSGVGVSTFTTILQFGGVAGIFYRFSQ